MPLIIMISVSSISILGMVLIPGVDASGHPYHMTFFEAFYFVSFMSTTIGFGEIPYAFTVGQRFWVALCIYPTVIAWLYTFGSILTLMQDKAFRQTLYHTIYARYVRNIREPFYLVCGYGTSGRLLVHRLTHENRQCVVIDVNEQFISELAIDDLHLFVPGLSADASESEHLVRAGLKHPMCRAIAAITDNDQVNLKIAITSRLLHPDLIVVARSEHRDVTASMHAFGTHHVIDPFEAFAEDMANLLVRPAHFRFQSLLAERLDPVDLAARASSLRDSQWILCGFGRLGQAIHKSLTAVGVKVVVIDAFPDKSALPDGSIIARGTQKETLIQAGIMSAGGIIAATSDDADNLSIMMAAKQLNERVFLVARQETRTDDALFGACGLDMIMQPNYVVVRKAHAWLSMPLLQDFSSDLSIVSDAVAESILKRIEARVPVDEFETWQLEINDYEAPAITELLEKGREIRIADLLRDPWHPEKTQPYIALFARQDDSRWMLPGGSQPLQVGMKLLFCGHRTTAWRAALYHKEALNFALETESLEEERQPG
ncbi:potassium channel family protein [Mariprofundus ferrooxydans]|uniref:potassium channel family protein n=1 Tax=Mariprofundus ferrooxydans TaxID=314344 RepID=UPI0014308759|nr:NAD-binding protein [Mariprofundus ferrooxydans]